MNCDGAGELSVIPEFGTALKHKWLKIRFTLNRNTLIEKSLHSNKTIGAYQHRRTPVRCTTKTFPMNFYSRARDSVVFLLFRNSYILSSTVTAGLAILELN